MKVLYDHQAFTMQHFGGVSKCFCELISHRPKGMDYEISIAESNNEHLLNYNLVDEIKTPCEDKNTFAHRYPYRGFMRIYNMLQKVPWYHCAERENKRTSIQALMKGDYDVFHPTFFSPYFLEHIGDKPFVLTIHDMTLERFKNIYGDNRDTKLKRLLWPKSSAIIAVSEQTKNDICDILNVPEEKVHVVYHGGPKHISITSPSIIGKPYFLYIGNRSGYKNWKQTIKDFAAFSRKHDDVYIVCTGKNFDKKEQNLIKSLSLQDKVIYVKASEEQIINLYTYAIAFIYPSLYEGFGMPILEAFAQNCPVLLNNKSCFPEIAGEAALYFDSDFTQSNLVQTMERIYTMNENERNDFIEKGRERLNSFSWEKSSAKLFEIYKSVLK